MAIWILAPDPNGTCCECSSRAEPCDSCASCGIVEDFSTLVQATQWIADNFPFTCFAQSDVELSKCDPTGVSPSPPCSTSDCNDTEEFGVNISYAPTLVSFSRSDSRSGGCFAGIIYNFETSCQVLAGTTVTFDFDFSGTASPPGTGGTRFCRGGYSVVFDSQIIFYNGNTDDELLFHGSFVATKTACFSVSAHAESETGNGPDGSSGSFNATVDLSTSVAFSQSPVWIAPRANYTSPSSGTVVCS